MNKIKVEICVGTSCFVMGASQIQALEFNMPEEFEGKVEISEVRCMELCKDTKAKYNRGPFVKVDGEVLEEATLEKVITKIREKLDLCLSK